jgi:hypothetical protein
MRSNDVLLDIFVRNDLVICHIKVNRKSLKIQKGQSEDKL